MPTQIKPIQSNSHACICRNASLTQTHSFIRDRARKAFINLCARKHIWQNLFEFIYDKCVEDVRTCQKLFRNIIATQTSLHDNVFRKLNIYILYFRMKVDKFAQPRVLWISFGWQNAAWKETTFVRNFIFFDGIHKLVNTVHGNIDEVWCCVI